MQLLDLLKIIDTTHCLVLTANRRLSTFIHYQYDNWKTQSGHHTWPTPSIFSFNTWLKMSYEEALINDKYAKLLLSPQLSLFVWENIIQQQTNTEILVKPRATAKKVADAWNLVNQWQLPLQQEIFQDTPDTLAFFEWAQLFIQHNEKNHIIDAAQLVFILTGLFNNKALTVPPIIKLIGFDEISPSQAGLLKALTLRGAQIQSIALSVHENNVSVLPLIDQEDEILTMARWAKQTATNEPHAYIACVVPNLHEIRDAIENQFCNVFTYNTNTPPIAYNISGGLPLAAHPLLKTLFDILHIYHEPIALNTISQLIRSPFIGDAETELEQRALLDLFLRKHGEQFLTLKKLIYFCENNFLTLCPLLKNRLEALLQLNKNQSLKKSGKAWMVYFLHCLRLMGWPGERTLSSEEYQYFQRFQQVLTDLTQLDLFKNTFSYQQAVHQLFSIAEETIFQPKNTAMHVQVLGLLEAAGSTFDYIWVMNMHDKQWPPPAKPNPFIPYALQRELKMPHACAQRELAFSQRLTTSLKHSAAQVLFSFPQQQEDEKLFKSPLLNDIPTITQQALLLKPYQPLANQLLGSFTLVSMQDYYGPPVQGTNIKGGTFLFKLQSLCPFRAFAELRLHAATLENPDYGLNALERGTLLHKILEKVWIILKSQQTLLTLSANELESIVETILTEQIAEVKNKFSDSLHQRFFVIEKNRLKKVILTWLNYEKTRPDFNVIATEEAREIQLGGLSIKLKVDRVDSLADGTHCIIDYKSSKPSIHAWFGERPTEPQLPLYCITHPTPVSNLWFAQVRADEMLFKGVYHGNETIGSVKTLQEIGLEPAVSSWHEQLVQWQDNLSNLAISFKTGLAVIDPKEGMSSCQFCELGILCRKNSVSYG